MFLSFLFTLLVVTLLFLSVSPCFQSFCLLSSCLLTLSYVSSVFVYSYSSKKIESILFIFRFLLKNHSILNWSSLFVKLCWFYLFFLFRPFFCLFFSMVFFRTRSSLPFFGWKNHLSNKSLQEFLFRFSVIGYFFKSSIIISLFKKIWIVWSPFFSFFLKKFEETCFTTKVALGTKTFLSRSHFVVISSCSEKYPSLQLFRKSLSLSYLLFFIYN